MTINSLNPLLASQVDREEIEWLWLGYLPKGKVVVLDGDPAQGKSTLLLDLAARLTTGRAMPDGDIEPSPEMPDNCTIPSISTPLNVLVISAEDDPGDTIRPRLEAAGADLDRVSLILSLDDLPTSLEALRDLILDREIALLVVDPVMAFLGKTNALREQSVRPFMRSLAELAKTTGCSIILIRHLPKRAGTSAVRAGSGSIAISAAVRIGWLASDAPDGSGEKILAVFKSNLAAIPPAVAYRLTNDPVHNVGRIEWRGTRELTADDLLGKAVTISKLDVASNLLSTVLKDGPVLRSEIEVAAKNAGIGWRTVERAKVELGIRHRQDGVQGHEGGGPSRWYLPSHEVGSRSAKSDDTTVADRLPSFPMGEVANHLRLVGVEAEEVDRPGA